MNSEVTEFYLWSLLFWSMQKTPLAVSIVKVLMQQWHTVFYLLCNLYLLSTETAAVIAKAEISKKTASYGDANTKNPQCLK